MMNYVRLHCIALCLVSLAASAQQEIPTIVPLPQSVARLHGSFALAGQPLSLEMFVERDTSLSLALAEIDELLRMKWGQGFDAAPRKQRLIVGIPSANVGFRALCNRHGLALEEKLGPEAYVLSIDAARIVLAANAPAGVFYGLQSLKQMLRGADRSLPSVRITDHPSYRYRGVMDDVSRGPVPTVDYVKYQIRRLAELKINLFMQYTEHVVRTASHPEFAPVDGSYTISELKELADYAARYHVRFAGNFQSFGHFNSVLAAPEYAHLGESGTLLSPVLPESYSFLSDIYGEMIPAFNAPFFAVNCDESFDLGKGASRKLVDSIGYDGAYFQHIMKLYQIVKRDGSRMMLWGDILLKYPALIGRLPKDVVIGTWTYDVLDSYDEYIAPFVRAGLEVFVVPGVLNSNRLFPSYEQAIGNIRGFALDGAKHHAAGIMTTVWDDGGSAFFSSDWPGVSYGAEQGWNPNTRPAEEYERRLLAGVYGSRGNPLMQAVRTLSAVGRYAPTDDLTDKVLFEQIVPPKGVRIKLNIDEWDDVARTADSAETLLAHSPLTRYDADRRSVVFTSRLYRFLSQKRSSLMHASQSYREAERAFPSDAPRARTCLVAALAAIDSICWEEQAIRAGYAQLWLGENHTYALERITSRFDEESDALAEIHADVFSSLRSVDSGKGVIPIAEVRLDIEQLAGRYFTEWLMTNPLPAGDGMAAAKTDFLASMGGERSAHPKVTQEFRFDTSLYRWRRTVSNVADVVNVKELFPETAGAGVVYAFATVDAGSAMNVTARVGCDEGIVVFCNGERVFEKTNAASLVPDEYECPLSLQKGKNTIMIKSLQRRDEWGFSFRLQGCEVRHRKNRYSIVR